MQPTAPIIGTESDEMKTAMMETPTPTPTPTEGAPVPEREARS